MRLVVTQTVSLRRPTGAGASYSEPDANRGSPRGQPAWGGSDPAKTIDVDQSTYLLVGPLPLAVLTSSTQSPGLFRPLEMNRVARAT
jgi:hypothetical protein